MLTPAEYLSPLSASVDIQVGVSDIRANELSMARLPEDLQAQLSLNYFTAIVSFAILYYDWFLTLSDEIERFWNRKNFTWASLFFFFNRYLVIFGNIPVILQSFWEPTNVSTKDMVCIQGSLLAAKINDGANRCLALAWMGQLGFDALVFCLTLYKSLVLRRSKSKTLIGTILRDGNSSIMTVANAGNIVTFVAAPPLAKGAGSVFTNAISATMMSRLMLNLRDPAMADLYSGRTPQGDVDTTLPVVTSIFDDHTIVRTAKSDEDDEPEQDLRTLHSSEALNNFVEVFCLADY
ncbi:hypothetical protein HWV62_26827 [Athelia sp. TMB]|nr:hypothetical protein HWV62_26827 [Athelia sp. TMB]